MKPPQESALSGKRHAVLPLILLALIYLAFLIAGGSTLSAAFHIPHDSTAAAYVAIHSLSIRWGSFCEMASAIPLGLFVFMVVSRLQSLRVRSAGW